MPEKKRGTRDTGHVTRDTGHVTRDAGHGTRDTGRGTRDAGPTYQLTNLPAYQLFNVLQNKIRHPFVEVKRGVFPRVYPMIAVGVEL